MSCVAQFLRHIVACNLVPRPRPAFHLLPCGNSLIAMPYPAGQGWERGYSVSLTFFQDNMQEYFPVRSYSLPVMFFYQYQLVLCLPKIVCVYKLKTVFCEAEAPLLNQLSESNIVTENGLSVGQTNCFQFSTEHTMPYCQTSKLSFCGCCQLRSNQTLYHKYTCIIPCVSVCIGQNQSCEQTPPSSQTSGMVNQLLPLMNTLPLSC